MAYTPLKPFLSVVQSIQDYVSRLGFLAEVRWVLNDIRVTPTGTVTVAGSLTTVTTCSTVTTLANQTSIWGYLAVPHIPALMNLEATNANIDNLIIT
mgnify:CR=1 FL=1